MYRYDIFKRTLKLAISLTIINLIQLNLKVNLLISDFIVLLIDIYYNSILFDMA